MLLREDYLSIWLQRVKTLGGVPSVVGSNVNHIWQ